MAYRLRPPAFWRGGEAIARIEALLGGLPDGGTLAAFLPTIEAEASDRELRCRGAIASTLLAGLELARQGYVTVEQEAPWAAIRMQQRQRRPADQAPSA